MTLAKQKEIVENNVNSFNSKVGISEYNIKATWFVSDGDKWIIRRSDDKILGNYLTFDQAVLIINALSFYMGE